MKIYLLDNNELITTAWKQYFYDCKDVEIVTDEFKHFMDNHKVDCVVSPGNSKGIMLGGYDLAITKYFGDKLTNKVQTYIAKTYKGGYQPVGSAFITDIPGSKIKLIHCPTMLKPAVIYNAKIVNDCMYNVLKVAKDNKVKAIVIPAFGGMTGKVNPNDLAREMFGAYNLFIKK
ncbi:MAG: macro domain-containing protein [Mycoplasma sp.]|nr:macro domain-containing protein [Candidatus Hennigella equi]